MNLYNVNTPAYLAGDEHKSIASFVYNMREVRELAMLARHPGYVVNPRCDKNQNIDYLFIERNSPFFDIPCEVLLHKDNSGFIDLEEWHYQLNCFMKTIFHRKRWSDWTNENTDTFLEYVWNNWKHYQANSEFDALEQTAAAVFADCKTLLEYHQRFIYNSTVEIVSLADAKELFDSLLDVGLFLSSSGMLYQVYTGIPLDRANTNIKRLYHAGKLSNMDVLHVKSKFKAEILPLLQTIKSKYNFIPTGDISKFEGMWLIQKIEKTIWFIPQFLIFYGKSV
jgi:hypothetical protein